MADPITSMNLWQLAAVVLGPGGFALGLMKLAVNGSVQRIKDIHADVREVKAEVKGHEHRISVIEGQLK